MSPPSISFLALLCLILMSTISAEHSDLGLSQDIDLGRELNYAKSSKRSSKDWMSSPGSQRRYNSKYAQHSDASDKHFYSRRHKRDHHHHNHDGITFDKFESWGINRIKEAIQNERDSGSRSSSSSSWRSSSTSSESSASSSDVSNQANDAPEHAEEHEDMEAIHLDTLDAARIEKEIP